jgi:hypothetical protein
MGSGLCAWAGSGLGGGVGLNSIGDIGPPSVNAGPGPLERCGVAVENAHGSSALRNDGVPFISSRSLSTSARRGDRLREDPFGGDC